MRGGNKKAAELAKRLANDYSRKNQPRFVAGSIGPGTKLPTLGHISFEDLKKAYDEQVRGLFDGGVDMFIVETCQDILQTKAALRSIFEFFEKQRVKLPVIAQVTIETFGTMLNGKRVIVERFDTPQRATVILTATHGRRTVTRCS